MKNKNKKENIWESLICPRQTSGKNNHHKSPLVGIPMELRNQEELVPVTNINKLNQTNHNRNKIQQSKSPNHLTKNNIRKIYKTN